MNAESQSADWRKSVAGRLLRRSDEIENAIFNEIQRLCKEPLPDADAWYRHGVRQAVSAGVAFAIEVVAEAGERPGLLPAEVLRQARRAAQNGVALEVVLQRHTIGAAMAVEFVAAETGNSSGADLSQVLSDLRSESAALADAVAAEYRAELDRETNRRRASSRLFDFLAGTVASPPTDIGYEFDRWHLGFIVAGRRAPAIVRDLRSRAPVALLELPREPLLAFAWFGSDPLPDRERLEKAILAGTPRDVCIAIGEPRHGVEGWRQTHAEAQIALRVIMQQPQRMVRWRDKAVVAAVLANPTAAQSLELTFLDPLVEAGGPELLDTLRAYFAADRNVEATASALGANRKTVERHIRKVERILGGHLGRDELQIRVALELQGLLSSNSDLAQREVHSLGIAL